MNYSRRINEFRGVTIVSRSPFGSYGVDVRSVAGLPYDSLTLLRATRGDPWPIEVRLREMGVCSTWIFEIILQRTGLWGFGGLILLFIFINILWRVHEVFWHNIIFHWIFNTIGSDVSVHFFKQSVVVKVTFSKIKKLCYLI